MMGLVVIRYLNFEASEKLLWLVRKSRLGLEKVFVGEFNSVKFDSRTQENSNFLT
jgi:hypothetical protein